MKPPTKKPNTPTLDTLRQQRADLLKAQAEAHKTLDSADVLDWRSVSQANADLAAIAGALDALDLKIQAAERELDASAAADRAALLDAERLQAVDEARREAKAMADALQHLDAVVFQGLDAALANLGRLGASTPPEVGVVAGLRRELQRTLYNLRMVQPVWFGLPAPPTAEQMRLDEARAAVARAEARVRQVKAYPGEDKTRALNTAIAGRRLAKLGLARLEGKEAALPSFEAELVTEKPIVYREVLSPAEIERRLNNEGAAFHV